MQPGQEGGRKLGIYCACYTMKTKRHTSASVPGVTGRICDRGRCVALTTRNRVAGDSQEVMCCVQDGRPPPRSPSQADGAARPAISWLINNRE